MKNISQRIVNFANYFIAGFGLVILSLLSFMILTTRSYIENFELTRITNNSFLFIIMAVIVGFIVIAMKKVLQHVSPKILFIIGAIIWLVIGVIYYLQGPNEVFGCWDQAQCFNIAKELANGNYDSLKDYYLIKYPFQIGLVFFERLFLFFSDSIYVLYFINIIIMILINFFQVKITRLLFDASDVVVNYVILFSFMFLPLLFYITYVYGNWPGLLFAVIAVYYGLRYLKDSRKYKYSWIVMVVFIGLANLIKTNYIITAIALLIVFGLQGLKNLDYKKILIGLSIFVGIFLANASVKNYYEMRMDSSFSQGIPKVAWITMGMQDNTENPNYEAGWFNFYTEDLYADTHENTQKTEKIARKDLVKQVKYYFNHPAEGYSFLRDKLLTTWTNPSYDVFYSTPIREKYLKRYDKDPNLYGFMTMMNMLNLYIVVFAGLYIVFNFRKLNRYAIYAILYLIGGFMFHFFWETKSQYIIQYMYMLMPLSAMYLGNNNIFEKIQQKLAKK